MKRLDPQCGEAHCQMWLPQSLVLKNTIPNPIRMSTLGGMSRKALSFIPRSKAPISLMGVAKTMCEAPLFSTKTLANLGIQLTTVFHLVATLCENGGTLEIMVRSKDTFLPHVVPHPIFETNRIEMFKVQPKSWHVIMAKLHDLPTWPTIDRTNIIPRVVVVHNEEGVGLVEGGINMTLSTF